MRHGLDHGKYFSTLVFVSVFLVTLGISNHAFAAGDTTSTPPGNYTLLSDTFDSSLAGWQYYGNPGYQLSLDRTTGVPSPSAHIAGDEWLGNCSEHGMYKTVDISQYTGGALTLGFDWRATSSSTYGTTKAAVSVNDADTGAQLFFYQLASSGATDTGWQHYSNNISSYISTQKRLQINLFLEDCWSVNYNETNWYDNVSFVWNNAPISPNAPTNLTATAVSSSQINLGWNAPGNNGGAPITGYKIERSTDFGSTWNTIVANTNSTDTTYSDTGLQSNFYTYRVSAINVIGTGPPSNSATANISSSNNGGKTIEFSSSGSFSGTVNASDTLIVDKGVTVSSNGITNYGFIRNMGTVAMNSSGTALLSNHGMILDTDTGTIASANINNYQSANFTNENTGFDVSYNKALNNYGNFTTYGGISAYYGHINNYQTGVIESYNSGQIYDGSMSNYGLVDSHGSITISCSYISSNGTFNSYAGVHIASPQCGGEITNGAGGTFNNFAGSGVSIPGRTGGYGYAFVNQGTVNNNGSFSNSDIIDNRGTFNNNGTVSQTGNSYGFPIATLTNYGTFNNDRDGAINNNSVFTNECKSSYSNNGTFSGNPVFGDCTTNQTIAITPTSGEPGTQVTITGNNFQPNQKMDVTFDYSRTPYTPVTTNPSTITSNSTGGFTATFAVPSTTYTGHTVAATDGTYSAKQTFTVTTGPPSAPTELNATAISTSQINLSWTAPTSNGGSAITGYNIYRGTTLGGEGTTPIATAGSLTLTYTDNGLAKGQTYYYKVTAVNPGGESAPSNEASAATASQNYKSFINDGFSSDLSGWQHYGDTGYTVSLDTATGQPSPSAHISGDAWLGICSKHGMYKVVDISSYSGGPLLLDFNWRASSSSASDTTKAEVSVDNADNGTQLFVYRLVDGGTTDTGWQSYFKDISSHVVGVKRVQIDLYLYDCWADDWNENNWYDNVSLSGAATTPPVISPQPPTGLTATAASSSQINLNWIAPSDNGGSPVTGYEVERANGDLSFNGFSNSTGNTFFSAPNATTFADTGLVASTTYNYTVFAKNSAGSSPQSNIATATTSSANGQPPTVTINNIQTTSGTISSSPYKITLSNFNAGTSSNQLLVVGIDANNNYATAVTFGGVPLTKKVQSFYNNDAEFWYLKNPAGTGNIVVTMSGPTSAVVGAYALSGVNQTSPIPTSTTNHNTSSTPNVSITTKYPNSLVLDLPSIYGSVTLGSPTCTQQWDINMPNAITGASSSMTQSTAGKVVCKWTASASESWDNVAIETRASG